MNCANRDLLRRTMPVTAHSLRKIVFGLTGSLLVIAPLYFGAIALGTRFGLWGWSDNLAMLIFGFGPILLKLALSIGILSLILSVGISPREGLILSLVSVALPLSGMSLHNSVLRTAESLPFIHDITTNTQDVPQFSGAILMERAAVEGANSLDYSTKTDPYSKLALPEAQAKGYPDLRPLELSIELILPP